MDQQGQLITILGQPYLYQNGKIISTETGKKLTNNQTKYFTLQLYDLLPQDKDVPSGDARKAREARTDIRDQIVYLNYSFFGWVARRCTTQNTSISFEDKFQSAVSNFMSNGMWMKYKWEGHYRCDLSFSVFFYLRLSETIDRELTTVKYSQYKPLQEELGLIVGKHWMKTTYEDMKDTRVAEQMSSDHIKSLEAIFGVLYPADMETQSIFLNGNTKVDSLDEYYNNEMYNDISGLLIREMIDRERKLNDKDIKDISTVYGLSPIEISEAIPKAEAELYRRLHDRITIDHYDE